MAEALVRIRVDFNARGRSGWIRARLRPSVTLNVGDQVVAYDPEDAIRTIATVADLDVAKALVFLEFDVERMETDVDYPPDMFRVAVSTVRAPTQHTPHATLVSSRPVRAVRAS